MSSKKLLSITNLKKYFPIAKSSIFQKEQLYVRANEDITLDIYEGETLGIVGESGCGKSTLGRVLLQLYPQTAGSTIYYGSTIDDMVPKYVEKTIKHLDKYKALLKKKEEKVKICTAKVEEAGGEEKADFFAIQHKNLAICEYDTALNNIVKIMGGLFVCDDNGKGRELLMLIYKANKRKKVLVAKKNLLALEIDHMDQMTDEERTKRSENKKAKYVISFNEVSAKIADIDKEIGVYTDKLNAVKAKFKGDPEFDKYEAMLDNGVDLARLKYSEMRLLRKDLQIIFQDPYSSLNPRFTVGQIIEEGLITHNIFKAGSKKMLAHVVKTMEECGLQKYMMNRYPHQFSGGQRQRISIARSLAVSPKFVVCDECVSALDVSIQSQIINLLQELKEKENLTYMFISHDLSVVRYISDRICVMYLGNVVELGDAATIFDDPRHPYTVALLSAIPTTDMESLKKERIILEGNIPSPIKPPSGCKFHTRCYMATEKCKRVPPPITEIEPGHFVACHNPERKLDQYGNYLFKVNTEKKSVKEAASQDNL